MSEKIDAGVENYLSSEFDSGKEVMDGPSHAFRKGCKFIIDNHAVIDKELLDEVIEQFEDIDSKTQDDCICKDLSIKGPCKACDIVCDFLHVLSKLKAAKECDE